MKAKVYSMMVYEGIMDWTHGGGQTIRRLVIEEADGLAITPHGDEVYVFTGFDTAVDDIELIGEVDVPDELVEKALAAVRAKAELDRHKSRFEALLGNLRD